MDYQRSTYFPFGFALRGDVWKRYRVDEIAEAEESRDKPIDTRGVRAFAQRMNEDHGAHVESAPPIGAGQLLTLGILTEVLRYLIDYYTDQQQPGAMQGGFNFAKARDGEPVVAEPPPVFVDEYPPQRVQLGKLQPHEFLLSKEDDKPVREVTAREMILLSLAMSNPAMRQFFPLFADDSLRARAPYVPLVVNLEQYFNGQPELDLLGEPLFEALRAPMRADPGSLEGQLDFIKKKWAHILPKGLSERLMKVQDILHEEYKERGGFVPGGMVEVMQFGKGQLGGAADVYPEFERFSADADWMSNVVMIAKSAYVWLDQLSKKYKRDIHRLDHIPDEELDQLARWGFNGLWLIGLWERSEASATIKRKMGNPDAVSSAYSLFDYDIAHDLGGDEAYANLRERARQRGIRLASDMVPNHMGMFSRWVVEHPHWFVQLSYPPYPNYTFTGPNLSHDPRVGLYIEDGYWTHSDAAVVFKRVDHNTGDTRYIYHGNDGTSMPWNDTAQLNYLMPEVREAVIQTILHVARKFPIIRFDAAMTLAKKHFQRLWYPKLGDSGAIPSRAEHGMSRYDFDRAMPEEFWREVVDRVAREVPDTLLLAEAFWLMEGYFVRTLGMHRVYNSAFMNMLKMEQNANYRATVRNVLEFSPEVLKRFVNFMNNPDERTAVEQFGKGDKYIGCCLLMITMPGLPMFGHGQIEGYTEKYGMEYRRAYWDEHVDEELVRRHERELFPIMRKRYLFSGVEHFAFYDFHSEHGHVDENVFAYSNRAGGERSLIFYNNAYNSTAGWIRQSTGLNQGRGDEGHVISKSLADALGLRREDNVYYAFRDHREGLEYIRHSRQLCDEGMFVHLNAYGWHAFIDWREIVDTDGSWGDLAWRIEGRGVGSLDYEKRDWELAPLISAFNKFLNVERLREFVSPSGNNPTVKEFAPSIIDDLNELLKVANAFIGGGKTDLRPAISYIHACCTRRTLRFASGELDLAPDQLGSVDSSGIWPVYFCYWLLATLRTALSVSVANANFVTWLDEYHLSARVYQALGTVLGNDDEARDAFARLRIVLQFVNPTEGSDSDPCYMERTLLQILEVPEGQQYLQVNEFEGTKYLNRERLEILYFAVLDCYKIRNFSEGIDLEANIGEENGLIILAKSNGYRLAPLVEFLKSRVAESKS